jgi:hypothetical protein
MNPIPTRCCICGPESLEGSVRVNAWRYQIKSIGTNALKWALKTKSPSASFIDFPLPGRRVCRRFCSFPVQPQACRMREYDNPNPHQSKLL